MCLKKSCVYIEIIELPKGDKIYIHYRRNKRGDLKVLWVDY